MEVVVTNGATRRAKLVISSPQTNQHPTFYRPDARHVAQPTVSKHERGNITFHGLAHPKLTWGFSTLTWTIKGSCLTWGGLPCLSLVLWREYPLILYRRPQPVSLVRFVITSSHVQQNVAQTRCARGDTICPRPSPTHVGAQAPSAPRSKRNVAVSSHADRCSRLTC